MKATTARDTREAAKLKLLQDVVRVGFDDIAAGRFVELERDSIESFISTLVLER